MPLVLIGTLLLIAYMADVGPFGSWPWWAIAAPFAGAVAWWVFADRSGWTQRRVMEKMERKKVDRREKAMDALGLKSHRGRRGSRADPGATPRDSRPSPPGESADPTQRDPPR